MIFEGRFSGAVSFWRGGLGVFCGLHQGGLLRLLLFVVEFVINKSNLPVSTVPFEL
jgi:hypothetical protein